MPPYLSLYLSIRLCSWTPCCSYCFNLKIIDVYVVWTRDTKITVDCAFQLPHFYIHQTPCYQPVDKTVYLLTKKLCTTQQFYCISSKQTNHHWITITSNLLSSYSMNKTTMFYKTAKIYSKITLTVMIISNNNYHLK